MFPLLQASVHRPWVTWAPTGWPWAGWCPALVYTVAGRWTVIDQLHRGQSLVSTSPETGKRRGPSGRGARAKKLVPWALPAVTPPETSSTWDLLLASRPWPR